LKNNHNIGHWTSGYKKIEKYIDTVSASAFPFMFGIYPYTFVTEKQREAMEEANTHYVFMSIYEITFSCVSRLLRKI